ncbi:hypothetical protein [Nitratireductor alexandrii]|uniref:hypothetical protein n=1 Tax=Nitratireductor alexandrii TaxID=2448161 RepID=UPI000FDAAA4A|nr:hypothetical protein [Nitratireductor alexandrii]
MKSKPFAMTVACAFAVLSMAAPAAAINDEGAFVRAHALDLLEDKLTDDQFTGLQLLAHQAAIASVCVGFELDETRFLEKFGALAHESEAEMSDEQKQYFERHLLVVYGILIGGELATAAEDPGETCHEAAEARADPEFAEEQVWASE